MLAFAIDIPLSGNTTSASVYLMERSPLDEIAELLIQVQSSRYLIGRVTTVKYTELAMIFFDNLSDERFRKMKGVEGCT
jgi:hypothetical protein